MVSVPVLGPAAVGVNVTLIAQLDAGERIAPQLLLWAKSPVATMLETLKGAPPRLLSVTDCAALVELTGWPGNPRLAPETEASGVAMPIPDNAIVCGLLPELSTIVMDPNRLPAAAGVNVTLMVQLAPAATLVGQLLSWAKSPVAEMLDMISAALPAFVSVTPCAALVVPIVCPENVNVLVERLATGTA